MEQLYCINTAELQPVFQHRIVIRMNLKTLLICCLLFSTMVMTAVEAAPIAYLQITITNTQNANTPIPFQQVITFNAANSIFKPYEANDLGNIRFYNSNSPITTSNALYSWCESGCNSFSTNAIFWVLITNAIKPNGNSIYLNMTFNSLGTEYDGVIAGESPMQSVTGYNAVATNYPIVNTSGSNEDNTGSDSTVYAPDTSAQLAICAGALSSVSVGLYNDYLAFDYGSDVNDGDVPLTNIGTQTGGGNLECNDYSGNGESDPVGTSLVSVNGYKSYSLSTAASYGQTSETDLYFTVTTYNAFVVVAAACGYDSCINGGGDQVIFPPGCSVQTSQEDGTQTESTVIATCQLVPGSYTASAYNNNGDSEMAMAAYVFQNYSVVSTPLNYGKYDNGANVFTYYQSGLSNTGWAVTGLAGISASTPSGSPFGANSLYADGSSSYQDINTGLSTTGNYIIQYYINSAVLGDFFFFANSIGAATLARLDTRGGGAPPGLATSATWTSWQGPNPASPISLSPDTWYMFQINSLNGINVGLWYSTALSYESTLSNINPFAATFPDSGGTETYANKIHGEYIGLQGDGGGGTTYLNGLIVRTYPPNDVMPSIVLGALTPATSFLTSTLFTTSINPITIGSTQTLTANIVGGIPPYTYNFLVYYQGAGLCTSGTATTNSLSASFSFTPTKQSCGSGAYIANVFITDNTRTQVSNTLTYGVVPISTGGGGGGGPTSTTTKTTSSIVTTTIPIQTQQVQSGLSASCPSSNLLQIYQCRITYGPFSLILLWPLLLIIMIILLLASRRREREKPSTRRRSRIERGELKREKINHQNPKRERLG